MPSQKKQLDPDRQSDFSGAASSEQTSQPQNFFFFTLTKAQTLIYNPTFRAVLFQVVALSLLVFFVFTIVSNALNNLESRGIATGFDFLHEEAGFGIGLSLIEYNESHSYGRTFWVGLLNTALVSILGIILATIVGFIMGMKDYRRIGWSTDSPLFTLKSSVTFPCYSKFSSGTLHA